MIREGSTVRITSIELTPYVDTSELFKVVSNKPYGKVDGWIDIANKKESIITQERFVEVVEEINQ